MGIANASLTILDRVTSISSNRLFSCLDVVQHANVAHDHLDQRTLAVELSPLLSRVHTKFD